MAASPVFFFAALLHQLLRQLNQHGLRQVDPSKLPLQFMQAALHLKRLVMGFIGRQIDVIIAETVFGGPPGLPVALQRGLGERSKVRRNLCPAPLAFAEQVDQGLLVDQLGNHRLGIGGTNPDGEGLAEQAELLLLASERDIGGDQLLGQRLSQGVEIDELAECCCVFRLDGSACWP